MPFLLLDDATDEATRRLQEFGQGLLQPIGQTFQQAGQTVQPGPQVVPPGAAIPNAQAATQRLQDFGSSLLQPLIPQAPTQIQEQPGIQDITQRLQDHGQQVLNQATQAAQQVTTQLLPQPQEGQLFGPGAQQAQANIIQPTQSLGIQGPTPNTPGDLIDQARQAAQKAGIDPDIFARQIQQESGFRPNAQSPAGALGIAQFMPDTARQYGVDPMDPNSALPGAARYMSDLLHQYGGDWSRALAAYNGGDRAVQRLDAGQPWEETRGYLNNILGGAKNVVQQGVGAVQQGAQAVQQAASNVLPAVSQFGDKQLSAAEAYAACGPAAAVRFAQMMGRQPTLQEAIGLAQQVGWTSDQGMAGLGSESRLFDKMDIPHRMVGADWQALAREASSGNPVTMSTPGHYFTADNYDPQSGAFHVGSSGTDLRGGSEWMTPAQMEARMGKLQGGMAVDNPQVPGPSPLSQGAQMLGGAIDQGKQAVQRGLQDLTNLGGYLTSPQSVRDLTQQGPMAGFRQNIGEIGQGLKETVGPYMPMGVLDSMQTISDLNEKYAGTPGAQTLPILGQRQTVSVDPEVMTPEDRARYQQAQFAVGGLESPEMPKLKMSVPELLDTLRQYPEDVKQGLRDFVQTQTQAGISSNEINDTLRQWVADNPLSGARPTAAAAAGETTAAEVSTNPYRLQTEPPEPGARAITLDERLEHFDALQQRYDTVEQQLSDLDDQLNNARGMRPERPPWAVGWTNNGLIELARSQGTSAYEPLWWEKVGMLTGSGEVREDALQSGLKLLGGRQPTAAQLRDQIQQLTAERSQLIEAANDLSGHADETPLYRPVSAPTPELPFDVPYTQARGGAAETPAVGAAADTGARQGAPVASPAAVEARPGPQPAPPGPVPTEGVAPPPERYDPVSGRWLGESPNAPPVTFPRGVTQDMVDAAHQRIDRALDIAAPSNYIAHEQLDQLLANKADPGEISRFLASVTGQGVGKMDVLRSLRTGAMAGGLSTEAKVAASPFIQTALRAPAGAINLLLSGRAGDIPKGLGGGLAGLAEGARDALQTMRYGINYGAALTGGAQGGYGFAPGLDVLGSNPLTRTLGTGLIGLVRSHGAISDISAGIGRGANRALGATPAQAAEAGQQWALRSGEYGMIGSAVNDAMRALRGKNPALDVASQILLPFYRVGYNVFTQGVERSPLGLGGRVIDALQGKPLDRAKLVNNLFGTGLAAYAFSQAAQGNITGERPEGGDPKQSVRLAGQWVPLRALGPAGESLAQAAALYESARDNEGDVSGFATQLASEYVKHVADETWLSSLADAMNTIGAIGGVSSASAQGRAQAQRELGYQGGSYVKSFIPQERLGEQLAGALGFTSPTTSSAGTYSKAKGGARSGATVHRAR